MKIPAAADLMEVAEVLAELGDARGLRAAQLVALEGPIEALRYRALWALGAITREESKKGDAADRTALSRIELTLIKLAETERSHVVQRQLFAAVTKDGFDPYIGREVLWALVASPHLSESIRPNVSHWLRVLESKP